MTDSVKEVTHYINKIMEERCTLIASSADYKASIMTAIVGIIDDKDEVVFDYSGSDDLDRLIRQGRTIDFSTYIDDINITFSSGGVEDTVYKGRPAFKIKIPHSIHKIQRRDFYRASPSISERPECVIEYDGNVYKASIIDIGIGGLSAFIQDADFKAGDVIERCRIVTSMGIEAELSMEIVYVGNELDGNGESRYGCMFKGISSSVESKLQQYVTYLQDKEIVKGR